MFEKEDFIVLLQYCIQAVYMVLGVQNVHVYGVCYVYMHSMFMIIYATIIFSSMGGKLVFGATVPVMTSLGPRFPS